MPSFGDKSGVCRPLVVVISLAICAVLLTRCLKSGVESETGGLGCNCEDRDVDSLSDEGSAVFAGLERRQG